MVYHKKASTYKLVGAMRLPTGLLDLDSCYRVNSFVDEGTHHTAKVSKARTTQPCPECNGHTTVHGSKTATVYHAPLNDYSQRLDAAVPHLFAPVPANVCTLS